MKKLNREAERKTKAAETMAAELKAKETTPRGSKKAKEAEAADETTCLRGVNLKELIMKRYPLSGSSPVSLETARAPGYPPCAKSCFSKGYICSFATTVKDPRKKLTSCSCLNRLSPKCTASCSKKERHAIAQYRAYRHGFDCKRSYAKPSYTGAVYQGVDTQRRIEDAYLSPKVCDYSADRDAKVKANPTGDDGVVDMKKLCGKCQDAAGCDTHSAAVCRTSIACSMVCPKLVGFCMKAVLSVDLEVAHATARDVTKSSAKQIEDHLTKVLKVDPMPTVLKVVNCPARRKSKRAKAVGKKAFCMNIEFWNIADLPAFYKGVFKPANASQKLKFVAQGLGAKSGFAGDAPTLMGDVLRKVLRNKKAFVIEASMTPQSIFAELKSDATRKEAPKHLFESWDIEDKNKLTGLPTLGEIEAKNMLDLVGIRASPFWKSAFKKAGGKYEKFQNITWGERDPNQWAEDGQGTCVGYGESSSRCDRKKYVCAGRGGTYGSADAQAKAVLFAIKEGWSHPNCPVNNIKDAKRKLHRQQRRGRRGNKMEVPIAQHARRLMSLDGTLEGDHEDLMMQHLPDVHVHGHKIQIAAGQYGMPRARATTVRPGGKHGQRRLIDEVTGEIKHRPLNQWDHHAEHNAQVDHDFRENEILEHRHMMEGIQKKNAFSLKLLRFNRLVNKALKKLDIAAAHPIDNYTNPYDTPSFDYYSDPHLPAMPARRQLRKKAAYANCNFKRRGSCAAACTAEGKKFEANTNALSAKITLVNDAFQSLSAIVEIGEKIVGDDAPGIGYVLLFSLLLLVLLC